MPATALDPKTALVLIDLQKGISRLTTADAWAGVLARAVELADAFRRAKLPVILVTVGFSPDEGDVLRPRADVRATIPLTPDFADLVLELGPHAGDILLRKRQPNAFYQTELDLQLRRRKVTGIVLGGVSTSAGVDSTARAAHERAYNITFASDAMTDRDPAVHEMVLTRTFPRMGEVDTTANILKLIST